MILWEDSVFTSVCLFTGGRNLWSNVLYVRGAWEHPVGVGIHGGGILTPLGWLSQDWCICTFQSLYNILHFHSNNGWCTLSNDVYDKPVPPVADPGGAEGAMAPPGPVKIGHKKDGHRRRPHRFHVSWPPPYPAAGSATDH